LGCRIDRQNFLVEQDGRNIQIRPFPIGIPFDQFELMAKQEPKVFNSSLQLVLGVDRLDYTKGLVQRLNAFELLLDRYPQHRGKVAFMQIAVPSRTNIKEYQDLKEEIDQLVGHINGRFSTPNWSPIRYIYGYVSQNELSAFYRDSAVAMVTPLRDGMNLVAKEFVACQILESPGVLILSPFAGASKMMKEALICNPYELDKAADTLHKALTMTSDDRIIRMRLLRRREKMFDVYKWSELLSKAMEKLTYEDNQEVCSFSMQPIVLQNFDRYFFK